MDTVDTELHLKELSQHIARLTVPGASAAAEVKVFMDSGLGVTAMSAELVEALRGQPWIMKTALMQAFVGHARVVPWSGQQCDIETQSCPLHITVKIPWGPDRFTMPFFVLPGVGDVVIIEQKMLRKKIGIDTMTQLKASVLKAHGRQDDAGVELTACSGRAQRWFCAANCDGCHGVRAGRRRAR